MGMYDARTPVITQYGIKLSQRIIQWSLKWQKNTSHCVQQN